MGNIGGSTWGTLFANFTTDLAISILKQEIF